MDPAAFAARRRAAFPALAHAHTYLDESVRIHVQIWGVAVKQRVMGTLAGRSSLPRPQTIAEYIEPLLPELESMKSMTKEQRDQRLKLRDVAFKKRFEELKGRRMTPEEQHKASQDMHACVSRLELFTIYSASDERGFGASAGSSAKASGAKNSACRALPVRATPHVVL